MLQSQISYLVPDRKKRFINDTGGDQLPSLKFEDIGKDEHPILPETTAAPTTPSTTTPIIQKTEKARLTFFTNSPIPQNVTSTTSAPSATKNPPPPDPRDVVRNEVQRAIDRLEGRGDPTPMVMDKNVDEIMKPQLSMETELKRYLLYAAPGIGCLLGLLPAVLLVKMCGVRVTLSVTLAVSGILPAIVPVLSQFGGCPDINNGLRRVCDVIISRLRTVAGFPALFPLRLFMGVCFAPCFPVMGAIAPLLSWPLTMLVFSNEFPLIGIYAFHAGVTLLLSILFATFHRDRPQHHPWVNGLELNKIVAGKVQELKSNRAQAGACPTLLRSVAAWSLWIAAFGLFFGIALVTIYMPSVLSCQEIFLVDYLGVYSVLPFMLVPLVMLMAGLINRWSCCSTTAHVRVCNTVGAFLTVVFFILLPIIFHLQKTAVSVHFLIFLLAPLGLCVSGVLRSLCLVGRAFTQHIIAYMGASLGVAFIVAPLVVFSYVASNSLAEWTKVFMTAAAIIAVSSIVFAIFGRGRASNWAASTWDPLISTKMRNLQPIDFSQDECGLYELRLIDPNKK
ncbi:hypothetical protein ANCDUO_02139 [Ancylostoma duodenale]|uniref:Transporter, major facilitator family protein n=1 Tax=Ancylostoma duodenale TaxID=51022 RepID=A0A0C2H7J2_9BILA|nr:hypothetical protein ANCDUO_02139 [Ancylostoma duodenale]